MNDWPNLKKDHQARIVEHLDSLRERLSVDIATKLSEYGSCPFWCFSEYDASRYKNRFQSYLKLLLAIARLVPRSTFLGIFPKDCGGCAIAQFFCIVAMHSSLHSEVSDLLRELLCDENGTILQMLPDAQTIEFMVRDAYKRANCPFPACGVCLNLDRTSEAYKIIRALGSMISSDTFIQLMKSDTEKAIPIARQLITNLKDPFFSDSELSELLKNK